MGGVSLTYPIRYFFYEIRVYLFACSLFLIATGVNYYAHFTLKNNLFSTVCALVILNLLQVWSYLYVQDFRCVKGRLLNVCPFGASRDSIVVISPFKKGLVVYSYTQNSIENIGYRIGSGLSGWVLTYDKKLNQIFDTIDPRKSIYTIDVYINSSGKKSVLTKTFDYTILLNTLLLLPTLYFFHDLVPELKMFR
jgi:hypothetical protein